MKSVNNGAVVVMLIPARTDTRYWHDYIMEKGRQHLLCERQIKSLENSPNSAPFPSAVVVF